MRESAILKMQGNNANNNALLYKQFQFLNTRMAAYEAVLSKRWNCLRALISPAWLKVRVDIIQMELLKLHDEEMRELAKQKKKEQEKSS